LNVRGIYVKRLNRDLRRSTLPRLSPQLISGVNAPLKFAVRENGLSFEISFNEGYSVGLFLDQRDNRRRFLVNHVGAGFTLFPDGPQTAKVLNAFAYTCGFSVAAAKAGAHVTSLDLSKKYLEWGKENFVRNHLDPASHDFIFGDAFDWMRRMARKGRRFDCVILDPPTFSQSKAGHWQAEKHFGVLVSTALPLLAARGVLLACSNAGKVTPACFLKTAQEAVLGAGKKILRQHYSPQPPDFPISRGESAHLKTVWLRIG
jgi:23S rRNA (cytosine1962-C5)-methyltransferase